MGHGKITIDQARHASCLSENDFRIAMTKIRGALQLIEDTPNRKQHTNLDVLADDFGLEEFLRISLKEIAQKLQERLSSPGKRYALFRWVVLTAEVLVNCSKFSIYNIQFCSRSNHFYNFFKNKIILQKQSLKEK